MGQACLIWGSFYGLSIKEGPFAIEYSGRSTGLSARPLSRKKERNLLPTLPQNSAILCHLP